MNTPKPVRRVLVVSGNRQIHEFVTGILPGDSFEPISYASSVGEAKRHERKTDEFGKQHAGYHSEHGTLFDPVILPRAKILACKGRQRN